MKETIAIVLAAGQGTRMKSEHPKVLHRVFGKTLLDHVIDNCVGASIEKKYVIVGHKQEEIVKNTGDKVKYILQEEQLGTGHALMQAKKVIEECIDGNVIVLMGDAPLISSPTINKILDTHNANGYHATVLTATTNKPQGYGRIVKDSKGNLLKIVEHKDCCEEELKINEINSGVYCFNCKDLLNALDKIDNNNAQGEYYLTDVIEVMNKNSLPIGICSAEEDDIKAVNSRKELALVTQIMKKRINDELMDQGVTIIDPEHTYIGKDVVIESDTIVYPGANIEGNTSIGKGCIVGMNTHIVDSQIGDEVEIQSSTILNSQVKKAAKIGPYAYIRPNCLIGERVKIGDFVEVKNSIMGDDSKASHLTYIGDAEVGSRVNLGCGVVFVNYDGKKKDKTVVEDDCFIGCNVNLIAPVKVKKGSYIAAGSTITQDVDEASLAIARCRQIIKRDYLKKTNK